MDKLQKVGIQSLGLGVVMIGAAFALPFVFDLTYRGVALTFLGMFGGPYMIILGIFLLINGDRSEAMLGPLGSDERRRKLRIYGPICAIPGIILCVVQYLILTQHGYHVF